MKTKKKHPAIHRAVLETLELRRMRSLAAPVDYNVGDNPLAVATGDVNGDGRSDAVTANSFGNNVSVLLGNFNGTMQAAQQYTTGAGPRSVAIADVNNDGKRDIVAANTDNMSVLLGNGNGTFQAPANVVLPGQFPPGYTGTTPVPQSPQSIAVGDLTGDGKLDLVAGGLTIHQELYSGYYGSYYRNVYTNYVNVLIGNGAGTFAPANAYTGNDAISRVMIADFNGDNKADVLSGGYYGSSLWLGNGNGTLQARLSTSAFGTFAIGDFDADGKLDIASTDGGNLTFSKGQGNGTFQNARNIPVGLGTSRSIATGDLNNDGKLDLALHTQRVTYESYGYYGGYNPTTHSETKVLLGFGDGTFSLPIVSADRSDAGYGSGPNATSLGDVNGDGRTDLLATEPTNDLLALQLNEGNWVAPVGVSTSDATLPEGNSGTVNAVLTITLDHAAPFSVSVPYSTADDSATAGEDFVATSGALSFSAGQTSKTITIAVKGDRVGEADEQFFMNLGQAANVYLLDSQGIVTITDDEPRLILSNNTSVTEGNSGTKSLIVTATLSAPSDAPVTVTYTPQSGSAKADADFVAAPGTITFQPGQTSLPIAIAVRGDTVPEYSESVYVIVTNTINALWNAVDGPGLGMINDDDAGSAVVIGNVSRAEGNAGTTPFTFTLTRLTPSERESFVYFSTSNGTASSSGGNKDYDPVTAGSGAVHFSPGQVNATVAIFVRGDTRSESDETFFVNLTSISDGSFTDAQGVGTILNDESRGKKWVGPATGGSWSTASNWSPSGVPTATSLVTVSGASVTLSSSATVAALSLNGAAQLVIAPDGNRVLRTGALFLDYVQGGDVGMLNLNDNDLILEYAGGAGNLSPIGAWNSTGFGIGGTGAAGWYDGILGAVANARSDGGWNLWGVTTSRPDALAGRTTLAVAEASQVLGLTGAQTALFAGQTVDATTVLVKYTYAGNAEFDETIDGDDFFAIDSGYAAQANGYAKGDFDYNGRIDADDYFLIDVNYSRTRGLAAAATAELPAARVIPADQVLSAYAQLMQGES